MPEHRVAEQEQGTAGLSTRVMVEEFSDLAVVLGAAAREWLEFVVGLLQNGPV